MAQDPASRFKLIESLPQAPGVDWITRTDKGPFVDTGVEVKFSEFGRLYLSVDTVRELAEAAGVIGQGPSDGELSREAAEYFRGYSDAVKENEIGHLDRLVERLAGVAAALRGTGGVAVEVSPQVKTPDTAPSGEPDDFYEEDESGVFTTDGPIARQDNQPARNQRPARIPSSAGSKYRL